MKSMDVIKFKNNTKKYYDIMDSEIWKPIQVQGFEGLYLISNLGNVWSVRKKPKIETRN